MVSIVQVILALHPASSYCQRQESTATMTTTSGSLAIAKHQLPSNQSEVFTSTTKEKIRLTKAEETSLASLFCRVQDAKSQEPILGDASACATLDRCLVDQSRTTFSAGKAPGIFVWASQRALRLDKWCEEFIVSHEQPVTVLHLACGLDCRYLRVRDRLREKNVDRDTRVGESLCLRRSLRRGVLQDSQDSDIVQWIDLDLPMVVDLRKRIFAQSQGDYALRTLDLSNSGWIRDLPADRPALIVAEGLLYYLEPETVQRLFFDVAEFFSGGQIVFDKLGMLSVTLTSWVEFLKSSKSVFTWGVDKPEMVEEFHPKLKLQDCVHKSEYMVSSTGSPKMESHKSKEKPT